MNIDLEDWELELIETELQEAIEKSDIIFGARPLGTKSQKRYQELQDERRQVLEKVQRRLREPV